MSSFANILVTTDFSESSLPAIDTAADLARRLGSRIELLFVVEDQLPPILAFTSEDERRDILDRQAQQASQELKEYADRHLADCSVETVTAVGAAAREIVRHAQAQQSDLIVIASHGYGPMRQLLLGSTAERVLHHAHCPVLVVPSHGNARKARKESNS